ncbi:MAG: hypothetical protein E7231_01250 [Cellulosilyticum sp.]|nr:hypothetical protein [Cellulosilyticum sp.]
MARKNVVDETAKVKESLSALPEDSIKEAPKKKGGRPKKVEAPVEDITIDGAPAEGEEDSLIKETTIEDIAAEVEQLEIADDSNEDEEIKEVMDLFQKRIAEIYSGKRSIRRAKKGSLKKLASEYQTTDGWKKDGIVVKNEFDYIREETALLAQAVDNYSKEIKTIHVTGVEPDDEIGWVVVGQLKIENPQYKIKVGLSEFIAYTQADLSGLEIKNNHDLTNAFRDIASRWIGTDIQVVITKVYQKSLTAYASRLMASELLAKYYFRRVAEGHKRPAFVAGSKVKAQIVEVKRDRVRVSVYGQDAWVEANECLWVFEGPLYNVFKPGKWVNVLILECNKDWLYENHENSYHLAKLVVSIKQSRPNPAAKNFENYAKGGIYEARPLFTQHNNGKVMCTMGTAEKQINILCNPSSTGVLGNKVKVMVDGKDEETCKLWGHIVDPNLC